MPVRSNCYNSEDENVSDYNQLEPSDTAPPPSAKRGKKRLSYTQQVASGDVPDTLKPFIWMGVDLDIKRGADDVMGECPFCGKFKFSVSVATTKWRCFFCNEGKDKEGKVYKGGNSTDFLRLYWEFCKDNTREDASLKALADDRGLRSDTLLKWGVVKSVITDEWLIPGYKSDGRLAQLYRYVDDPARKMGSNGKVRKKLLAVPTLEHGLFKASNPHPAGTLENKIHTIYLCEGPWDGMSLYQTLSGIKVSPEGKYSITGNAKLSLIQGVEVLAVPGCSTFSNIWHRRMIKKKVIVCYDNDYPVKHPQTGQFLPPVGTASAKRVVGLLAGVEEKPESIHYLAWDGGDGSGYDKSLPNGCDVRDILLKPLLGKTTGERLVALFDRIKPAPDDWLGYPTDKVSKPSHSSSSTNGKATGGLAAHLNGKLNGTNGKSSNPSNTVITAKTQSSPSTAANGKPPSKNGQSSSSLKMELLPCEKWDVLVNHWRKAMKWTEGLDRALSVMLACIISTRSIGDQLWVKVIGPAGCGKTTLCEAISTSTKYVVAKSTIKGFHSGYKTDKEGSEDNSLMAELNNKTLVSKDGDTILQSPNRDQILSEARDLYDGVTRTYYRNGMGKEYKQRMTWILCGTSGLRVLDSSELGERFIDCIIMELIDDDLEDEILIRKIHSAFRAVKIHAGKGEQSTEPELVKAYQLTGGYIEHLHQGLQEKLEKVETPDEVARACTRLGKFVAYMRARPSKKQEEVAEREFAARLVSQLGRLAVCLAVVMNKTTVDEEVMRRVRQTALDTARGRTMEISRRLLKNGVKGVDVKTLSTLTHETEDKLRYLLRFLRKIGATQVFQPQIASGVKGKPRWRLTDRLIKLYSFVLPEEAKAALQPDDDDEG